MDKYGLIGKTLSHSYSKIIHEKFYLKCNIDAQYDLINTSFENLENMVDKLRNKEYNGFNITIPYKTEILKYADVLSPSVLETNSCNTLLLKGDKVYACNTDVFGFDFLLNYNSLQFNKAFVLGDGGSSKSVQSVLNMKQIDHVVISRKSEICNYDFLYEHFKGEVIINTTPIGMYPNINESVVSRELASKASAIVDLIYNPKETLLMSYNKNSYNGLPMLVYQASVAFELFTGIKLPTDYIRQITKELEVLF